MKFLKRNYKILVSILHGGLLFVFLWMITNSSYSSGLDESLLSQIYKLDRKLHSSKTNYGHPFIFVNISRDIKLQDDPANYGTISITDRSKLAAFFKLLADNGNHHYQTLCDIFLEYPDEDDSLLQRQVKRCKNLLFPYHLDGDKIKKPSLEVNYALSNYQTFTGNFSKFRLDYGDSLQTTPVALLEKLDNKKYPSNYLDFRNIFPRYYINQSQVGDSSGYPLFNLGELLMLSATDSFYTNFLKDRFIVIGNFDTDLHNSPVGKITGPLILLNTYLTLHNAGGISWWWALFMISGLAFVSYILFFKKIKPPESRSHPWLDLVYQLFVNNYFSFSGICILLLLFSDLIFSVRPNISILLLYLLSFNFLKKFYKKHYKKKQ